MANIPRQPDKEELDNILVKFILPQGVRKVKNYWGIGYRGQISKDGISYSSKWYKTPEEAHEFYKIKYKELYGEDFST